MPTINKNRGSPWRGMVSSTTTLFGKTRTRSALRPKATFSIFGIVNLLKQIKYLTISPKRLFTQKITQKPTEIAAAFIFPTSVHLPVYLTPVLLLLLTMTMMMMTKFPLTIMLLGVCPDLKINCKTLTTWASPFGVPCCWLCVIHRILDCFLPQPTHTLLFGSLGSLWLKQIGLLTKQSM